MILGDQALVPAVAMIMRQVPLHPIGQMWTLRQEVQVIQRLEAPVILQMLQTSYTRLISCRYIIFDS